MRDEPDPPRKHYQLKEPEYERVNEVGVGSASPTVALPASSTGFKPISPLGNAPADRDNDVRALLRENQACEAAKGLYDLPPKPRRKSRRLRDYLLAMALGNGLLVLATISSPIFGGAGLIIFNLGVTWTMWFVMDDY